MKGGRLYYDMPIGILCLESLFPKPRGHMRNPLTYGFPTVTRVIRGVDIPRLLFNPTPDLLEPFIQAAKELEADGVQAITGSCGFMARFQSQIAAELHIPVFLSSLLQLPLVRLMHGEKAEIGVLTASSQALTPAHFANCATPMESVHIRHSLRPFRTTPLQFHRFLPRHFLSDRHFQVQIVLYRYFSRQLSATIALQLPDQGYNLRHTSSSCPDNKLQRHSHSPPHP